MELNIEEIRQEIQPIGANIYVVGVGGCGNNMINNLYAQKKYESIKLIAMNTDAQQLSITNAQTHLKLGEKLTRGLGAGMKPEIGEKAALETYEEIKEALKGADMVFISAGLGGGTGTGAAPIIAKAARDAGILTISVVTKPFINDGPKKTRLAEEGLKKLKEQSDCIVVIPNERVLSVMPKNCGRATALKIVDNVLIQAVNGIAGVILTTSGTNIDFADLKTAFDYKGLALMGVGEASGENAAVDALNKAIESPLLDNVSINNARGLIVCYEKHEDYSMMVFNEANGIVCSLLTDETDYKYGVVDRSDFPLDFVRVTVIATGFEQEIVGQNIQKAESSAVTNARSNLKVMRKVSGDSNLLNMNTNLDIPTYLRNQKD